MNASHELFNRRYKLPKDSTVGTTHRTRRHQRRFGEQYDFSPISFLLCKQLLRFISPFLLLTPAWASANVEHLRKVPSAQSTISSVELMITKKIMENLSPPKPGRSLSTGLSFLDFSEFSEGETVYNLGNGITVTATKQTGNGLIPGKAMIFDSAHPTGQDSDLGTPNIRYGGPGVGKDGGGPNKLFPNTMPRGNILIISEDENSDDPDDNAMGGELRFSFDPPRYLATVGLLDNDGTFELSNV